MSLDVLLARPLDLNGSIHMLGDLDGTDRAVGFQTPAEAAADQAVVHNNISRQSRLQRCSPEVACVRDMLDFEMIPKDHLLWHRHERDIWCIKLGSRGDFDQPLRAVAALRHQDHCVQPWHEPA
jgi:hypothetical protein